MRLYKIRHNNACSTIPNQTIILVKIEDIYSPKLAQSTACRNWGVADDMFEKLVIRIERQLVLVIRP